MNKFFVFYNYENNYFSQIINGTSAEEVKQYLEFEWGYLTRIIFVEPLEDVEHQFISQPDGSRYFFLQ